MIYELLRPLAKLGCLLYFRKIFLLNSEVMPAKGPLLLVCNHPSSFFEAVLMAILFSRPLHFLTRGDFFNKPLFAWFLRQTHQVPIFRTEDGFDKLRSNQDTFAFCLKALKEDKVIIIFPETRTETEKRLRPLQKGAARIALSASRLPEIPSPFRILPVGVTFSDPVTYRSTVTFRCGELIEVEQAVAEDREYVSVLTQRLEQALATLITQISDPGRERTYDALHTLLFHDAQITYFPTVSYAKDFPGAENILAQEIAAMPDETFGELNNKVRQYNTKLREAGLTDKYLHTHYAQGGIGKLLLIFISPVLLLGGLVKFLPARLVHGLIVGKIRRIPFFGPTKWALGLLSYGLFFLLIFILSWIVGKWPGILTAAVIVMSGYHSLQYVHDLNFGTFFALLRLSPKRKSELEALRLAVLAYIPESCAEVRKMSA